MRIAVIADCHIGNHTRYATPAGQGLTNRDSDTVRVFTDALARAAEYPGLDYVVVAGDLFHNDKPSPATMAAVMAAIEQSGLNVLVMVGNHDRTADLEDALLPLQTLHNCSRVAVPRSVADPAYLGEGAALLIPAGLEDTVVDCGWDSKVDVIIAHHGVWGPDTPAFLRNTKGALSLDTVRGIMRATGASLYLSGDWHQHRVYTVPEGVVVQIGALCPTGFADETHDPQADPYGSLLIVNSFSRNYQRTVVPHPVFAALDYPVSDADRHHPYPVYVRSPEQSGTEGAVRYVAGGGVKRKEAAAVRVAATVASSRETILAAITSAVLDAPADELTKIHAITLLTELA